MTRTLRSVVPALLSCLFLSSVSAQAQLAKPVSDMVNGHIPRVMNNGPTAWADTNGWKLVLERTVQPPDGDPGMLGKPSVVLLLGDGRLVVSEQNPGSIKLYDAKGLFVRTLGRAGEGPGEYRRPRISVFHDTLVIHDPTHSRGTIMTLDGKLVREFPAPGGYDGYPTSVDSRGRLQVVAGRKNSTGMETQLVFTDLRGTRLDSMLQPAGITPHMWQVHSGGGIASYSIPFTGQTVYRVLHDGSVVFGPTDNYELTVKRSDRDTVRRFGRRDMRPVRVPSQIRDTIFHQTIANPQLREIAKLADIPETYPFWNSLSEDPAGNIWVSMVVAPNSPNRFDVFAPNGNYLGAVASPFPSSLTMTWSGNRLAVADTDDNDLPRIRIFRIDRKGH